ncbi:hypothetical protein H4R33_000043 [Dimargaris cristalligena]|uniref:Uncharacterized protein n=1 Tax=Dimargaris cristalligena TaxID=215637 RepID=A0A4P9ZXM1_9FUNG|nr:hypothetical protein H4R33_000043 [Dimargaris cristalligena]RKP38128.1 hypothetical protein BJ085DRAFT_33448 [Dimargaris cristalligena]|eukprot:RKP38128.1 hypothetical protein BJ085DRAFT_33448 [Dimargaris cristalligena]
MNSHIAPRSLRFAPSADKENSGLFSPAPGHPGKAVLGAKTPLYPKTTHAPSKSKGPLASALKPIGINTPIATRGPPLKSTTTRLPLDRTCGPTVHPVPKANVGTIPDFEPEYMAPRLEEPDFDPEIEIDWEFLARPPMPCDYEGRLGSLDDLPLPSFEPEGILTVTDEPIDWVLDSSVAWVSDFGQIPEPYQWSKATFSLIPRSATNQLPTRVSRSVRSRRRLSHRPSRLRQPTNWRSGRK